MTYLLVRMCVNERADKNVRFSRSLCDSSPRYYDLKKMELFRTNSPEGGPFHFGWRRKSFLKSPNPAHSTEERSFFTTSLPTPTLSAEMAMRSPKFSNSMEAQNEMIDDDSSNLSPPHSGHSSQRPRSASLHGNLASTTAQLQVHGKRKSLRTLTRSRPSSARFGRSRSDSINLEQEATAAASQVDNAFAKIKSQLAQLSEEDAVLQERLDRLTTEISYMQKCVGNLHYSHHYIIPSAPSPQEAAPVSPSSPISPSSSSTSVPRVTVSTVQPDILAIAEETWEEEREFERKHHQQQQKQQENKSKYFNIMEPSSHHIPEIRKKESLGSCGSLADSEGSLSPGRQTCCIVVVDHDKCLLSPRPMEFSYEASPSTVKYNYEGGPSPLKFNYEDDVFFT